MYSIQINNISNVGYVIKYEHFIFINHQFCFNLLICSVIVYSFLNSYVTFYGIYYLSNYKNLLININIIL